MTVKSTAGVFRAVTASYNDLYASIDKDFDKSKVKVRK